MISAQSDEDSYLLDKISTWADTEDGKAMAEHGAPGMPVVWLIGPQAPALRRLVDAGQVEVVKGGRNGDRSYLRAPSR